MSSPVVHSFYHKETGTWSYVVADPATRVSAIIDPVLDYDSKSGRTSTTSAQQLIDTALQNTYRIEWILETHAHADHLSAAVWLQREVGGRIAIGAGIDHLYFHQTAPTRTAGSACGTTPWSRPCGPVDPASDRPRFDRRRRG